MSWFTRHGAGAPARRGRRWLRRSTANLAALLDSASDPLWAIDAGKRFVFGNRVFVESFYGAFGIRLVPGMRPAAALARDHPEVARQWDRLYDRALAGEQVTEEQPYVIGGQPRIYLVSIQPVRRRRLIVGASALSKDITALKGAERSLHAAEERFARVFHVSPAPILISSPADGRIIDANAAFAGMFGYQREEILGRTTLELGMWVDPAARARAIEAVLQNGSIWNLELEFRKRSGKHGVALGGFVLTELGGQPCLVGVAEEITERKEWEDRAQRAARTEAIGQLASGVAHEFNNLLTVILGGSDLLGAQGLSPEARRRVLEKIRQSALTARELTQQLLAFGRRQPLRPSSVDPNELVRGLVALLQRTLGEQISLRRALAPKVPPLWLDRARLEQVLLNLAINAREAMPLGGTITFRTRVTGPELDRPRDVPPGPLVELEVSDTGVGMDKQTLERAFVPFFTTHAPGHGYGLGLSMVHGIVRQSGGFIRAESEPGRGTTFHLYFPAARAAQAAAGAPAQRGRTEAEAEAGALP